MSNYNTLPTFVDVLSPPRSPELHILRKRKLKLENYYKFCYHRRKPRVHGYFWIGIGYSDLVQHKLGLVQSY